MTDLQLLTATGARPEAWALCQRWAARQTYTGRVTWIIVDDGPIGQRVEPMPDNWQQVVIRRAPYWQRGQNTQAANLLRGLEAVDPALPLVIWEDDDWYAPDWLTTVAHALQNAELVGENMAYYYNVAHRKWRQMHNTHHASLCATAMQGAAIETFRRMCKQHHKFIDIELWRAHRSRHLFAGHRVVGIKGLPGRGGIGSGHDSNFRGQADANLVKLREWIGSDADAYAQHGGR